MSDVLQELEATWRSDLQLIVNEMIAAVVAHHLVADLDARYVVKPRKPRSGPATPLEASAEGDPPFPAPPRAAVTPEIVWSALSAHLIRFRGTAPSPSTTGALTTGADPAGFDGHRSARFLLARSTYPPWRR